jgi:superfamily II DNA or RNA helicase
MSWKLNEKSTILGQPEGLLLPLREHQKAMLYKCLVIEKESKNNKFPFGVISEPAGAGKTAVIISVILSDKIIFGKTQNLIVVPQNIHSQWISEFKKFSGDNLKVKSFIEYSDISSLFTNTKIVSKYDVLVTTTLYYELIYNTLAQNNITLKRIIFDEIDTSNKIIEKMISKEITTESSLKTGGTKMFEDSKKDFKCGMTWFVSASFNNVLKNGGFYFMNNFVSEAELQKCTCLCEKQFLEKSNFQLEEPEIKTFTCSDLVLDKYWQCLSVEQIDLCNSLSWTNLNLSVGGEIANNSEKVLKGIVNSYIDNITRNEKVLEKFSREDLTEEIEIEQNRILKEINFYKKLLAFIHSIGCDEECVDTFNCINEKLSNKASENKIETKVEKLREILETVKDKKVLIFSDFSGTFNYIGKIISEYSLKCMELSGGSVKEIADQIHSYKNGDINVLMIDSSSQGCGINLENTDDIIFIHKTSETLYKQIVGRAFRPGRTSRLTIHTLINDNEITV